MSKVFLIERPRQAIDFSNAKRYGRIVFVFDTRDRRCGILDTKMFGQTILQRLIDKDFDPKEDSICIVGSILVIVVSIVAVAQYYDSFNLLLFNSINGIYVKKRFDKNNWKEAFNGLEDETTSRDS